MKYVSSSVLAFALLAGSAAAQGAVYTSSNSVNGNEVIAFDRAAGGSLTPAGSFATGGAGTGAGLGSQAAVTLTRNGQFLLVVNAGSDDVSVFRVDPTGLTLVDREPSRGDQPISVAEHTGRVYVLNTGDFPNVAGFTLSPMGDLQPIAAMPASLATGCAPAQVGIGPGGAQVFVTEKATNLIDVFRIGAGGMLNAPTQIASNGMTPFGFDFGRNDTLIVSEAAGGAANASSASSYRIGLNVLNTVTSAMPTTESAACWIVMARSQRYAYTTNTASGTVTGYRVMPGTGALMRLDFDGVTGDLGAGTNPLDGGTSLDGKHMYVISPATGEIGAFFVRVNGSLEKRPSTLGLPSTMVGLAAR